MLAFTDDDVASSAAIAIITAGLAKRRLGRLSQSRISVSDHLLNGERPEDTNRDQHIEDMVMPSAMYMARGRFRAGSGRSPPVKLITAKPR